MRDDAVIRAAHIGKTFASRSGKELVALDDVSLAVTEGEFVCLLGPSGCGKSTLLRILAGLETHFEGSVFADGEKVAGPSRKRGMVFQEYSLFPWRNIEENVAAGLEFAGVPADERRERSLRYLELVGLSGFARALPHELSGGMRQRAAIARALAADPHILLMDEPFGALDAHTRILLQKELLRIWSASRKTVIFVTHSVDEAVYLADRIVVMSARPGRIVEEIEVDMERPRRRDDPRWGVLAARILALPDEATADGGLSEDEEVR